MPSAAAPAEKSLPLSALDLQILLVLLKGELYGYAIKKSVEKESGGILSPEIGSLYRVLNRLMDSGWVEEKAGRTAEDGPRRGRPRRYYRITNEGTQVVRAELRRLRQVLEGAEAVAPGVA
jgi:DNA-binding PadR family transcriptional regulator